MQNPRKALCLLQGLLLTVRCRKEAGGKAHQHRYTSEGFVKDRSFEERLEVRRHLGTVPKPTEADGKKG